MDIYILDKDFNNIAVIDQYQSVLWIDRYLKPGEFEIYTFADEEIVGYLLQGNYLIHKDSEHVGIVEGIKIETDSDDGNHATFTGRSLESILDRRIIWKQTVFNDKDLQDAIEILLNENLINPTISERKISNFVFKRTEDATINTMKLTAQYTGDNLLDVITEICEDKKIGFKITPNERNEFVFELYSGVDRSYAQFENPFVIFSPEFENIINSNYLENLVTYKNVTLVAGDGEGADRKSYVVGNSSGMDRRELYTDARDISSTDNEGKPINISIYNKMLEQRGLEKLSEYKEDITFDGQMDPNQSFIFKRDFFMGDVVQIKNEYGVEGSARIIEYVISDDEQNGFQCYPTFEAVQYES